MSRYAVSAPKRQNAAASRYKLGMAASFVCACRGMLSRASCQTVASGYVQIVSMALVKMRARRPYFVVIAQAVLPGTGCWRIVWERKVGLKQDLDVTC